MSDIRKPNQQQWDEARKDGEILEAKIAALVEEFEKKHKPIQVSVITRWRNFRDKYIMSKGGSAQIVFHDCSLQEKGELPSTIHNTKFATPINEISYSDAV